MDFILVFNQIDIVSFNNSIMGNHELQAGLSKWSIFWVDLLNV